MTFLYYSEYYVNRAHANHYKKTSPPLDTPATFWQAPHRCYQHLIASGGRVPFITWYFCAQHPAELHDSGG